MYVNHRLTIVRIYRLSYNSAQSDSWNACSIKYYLRAIKF